MTLELTSLIQTRLAEAAQLTQELAADAKAVDAIEQIAECIVQAFGSGNKVLVAGNGGSMADAMHFAEEFTGRFKQDRRPYPVMPLGDSTHLTCVGNDYGYEFVFSRMVEAFGQRGDVLVVLSTSGNSKNLILAAEAARQQGLTVIGLLGRSGGGLAELCDVQLHAPGQDSDRIQELHMLSLHVVIDAVERTLGHG